MPGAAPVHSRSAVATSMAAPPDSTAVKAGRVAATCTAVSRARSSGSMSRSQWRPQRRPGPRTALASARAGTEVVAQPGVDRLVPEQAVGRLQHPVVLGREVQELRLDALALQRGERGDALFHRNAVVVLAVHDEHRHAPLRDVVDWVEPLVTLGILVRRAAVLP